MTRPTILIVDDDQSWIDNIIGRLAKDYDVDTAHDLKKMTELLDADGYVLIIASSIHTDILEIIHKQYPNKRLVVATNKPTTQEAIKMYDYGALDYFPKHLDEDVNLITQRAIRIPANVPKVRS